MAFAGRSVLDKVAAIILPITVFVAAGFEHSIANLYLIPMGMLLPVLDPSLVGAGIGLSRLVGSLVPVILGNIVGGAVLVAAVHHLIYRRGRAA